MPKKEVSFEEAIKKLEEIVDSLENGDFPLEESLKLYVFTLISFMTN